MDGIREQVEDVKMKVGWRVNGVMGGDKNQRRGQWPG